MLDTLPIKLEREPLIDAVFEARFKDTDALADILPGFLFHELKPTPVITRLPAAEIPKPMRASDPGLQYAPTQRLEWGQFFIAIGDRNVIVSCKMPYPKWPTFKTAILDIVGRIEKLGIGGGVERYSLKYVNLIQAPSISEQVSKIKLSVELGDIRVQDEHLTLQIHRQEAQIIHILRVITGAEGSLADGQRVFGMVVDVDSIRIIDSPDFETFVKLLRDGIEALRQANKAKFFGCLTDAAIQEMGPVYEREN